MSALLDAWSNKDLTVTVEEYLGLASCEDDARLAYGITVANTNTPDQTKRDVVYCTPSEVRRLLSADLPDEAKAILEKGAADFRSVAEISTTCMPTALESRKEQTRTNVRGYLGLPDVELCVKVEPK